MAQAAPGLDASHFRDRVIPSRQQRDQQPPGPPRGKRGWHPWGPFKSWVRRETRGTSRCPSVGGSPRRRIGEGEGRTIRLVLHIHQYWKAVTVFERLTRKSSRWLNGLWSPACGRLRGPRRTRVEVDLGVVHRRVYFVGTWCQVVTVGIRAS